FLRLVGDLSGWYELRKWGGLFNEVAIMPHLSRWFVRVALFYLSLGVTLGALLLANKGIPFAPFLWNILPAHIEFMFLGWMSQFALGIAFWILPRLNGAFPRGDERWTWNAFLLLNAGIWLVALAPGLPLSKLSLLGRVLEALAFWAFVIGNWRRIYPPPTDWLRRLHNN
ncbi:MAG: hypothetical protein ACP5QU_07380, partial [Anaerolineae bacterium]